MDPVLFLVVIQPQWACKFLRIQIFFLLHWLAIFFKVTYFYSPAPSEHRRPLKRSHEQPTLQTIPLCHVFSSF